jgi:hypothetical protein
MFGSCTINSIGAVTEQRWACGTSEAESPARTRQAARGQFRPCSSRATALCRLRATERKARWRSAALSITPWRGDGSMRLRNMLASRSRGWRKRYPAPTFHQKRETLGDTPFLKIGRSYRRVNIGRERPRQRRRRKSRQPLNRRRSRIHSAWLSRRYSTRKELRKSAAKPLK